MRKTKRLTDFWKKQAKKRFAAHDDSPIMLKPPVFVYRNVSIVLILGAAGSIFALRPFVGDNSWAFLAVPLFLLSLSILSSVLIKRNGKRFKIWRSQINALVKESYGIELNKKELLRLSTPLLQSTQPVFVDGIHHGPPNLVFYAKWKQYYYVSYPTPVGDGTKRSYILTIEPNGQAQLEYIVGLFQNREHDLVPFKDPYQMN